MAHPTDMLSGLTRALLAEVLDYDPATGHFTWKSDRVFGKIKAGTRAGTVSKANGYRQIWIGERTYNASRLAYLWMEGEWPKTQVDHINLDRSDDRWSNLRPATAQQNCANRGLKKTNTSGLKGASLTKWGRWLSTINVQGKSRYLGTFDTKEEASAAYFKALTEAHGEFADATRRGIIQWP